MVDEKEELDVDEVMEDDEVYIEYDIASYPSDLTLSVLNEMWANDDIVIPKFQRKFVWTVKQSSLLIESFLLGLPVPQIFLYVDENKQNLVIDGQQRILSVVYFMEGYFGEESTHGKRRVFRLTGLDKQSPYSGKRWQDLSEQAQRKLKGAVLRAINIRQLSPDKEHTSIYHIFERLNTGGTPLKPQEIRNCVFLGKFADVLRELNEDENWRRIIGKQTIDRHQKDVELVLRIFALSGSWRDYEKPMKEFLNVAMATNRDGDTAKVKKFQDRFRSTAEKIIAELGEKPFHIRGPLNSSALDSVFATMLDNQDNLVANVSAQYKKLLANDDFTQATYYGTSDASVLIERFKAAENYLVKSK